ncbi:MAG: hypothetical protein E2P02_26510 [Acidobacteria bacterium]|nr:MAG: hypothetical protein E2P02_26510 [Acidobacteriota bacterium]
MARQFTQKHAKEIAKKLGMVVHKGRRIHDHAVLIYEGKEVVSFGIRRASKEVGHDHLPKDLHLRMKDCKDLHRCTLSRDDYLELLRDKELVSDADTEGSN